MLCVFVVLWGLGGRPWIAVVGAALNVRINLGSIEDCDYTARAAAEIDKIQAEAAKLRGEVLAITLSKL